MKIVSSPQSGRVGPVVYINSRYGQVARQYVPPRNPRTPDQQLNRGNFAAVSSRWRGLTPEQHAAWVIASANRYIITATGRKVPLNAFSFFVSINRKRADLGLPQFDLPPAEPTFSPNPVAELVATITDSEIILKLRVRPPAQYTLVQGARPVSASTRCVQHFPFSGLLPPPIDGWCEITGLYVAHYGLPPVGTVIFIRTVQHIDGWTDVPKATSARILAAAS